jgi:hypothetical protein
MELLHPSFVIDFLAKYDAYSLNIGTLPGNTSFQAIAVWAVLDDDRVKLKLGGSAL